MTSTVRSARPLDRPSFLVRLLASRPKEGIVLVDVLYVAFMLLVLGVVLLNIYVGHLSPPLKPSHPRAHATLPVVPAR